MLVGRIRSISTFSALGVPDNTGLVRFTTLADVKLFLDVPSTDTSEDVFLDQMISMASTAIEAYLDRLIVKRRVVEVFPSNRGPLTLTHHPVIQAVSVSDQFGVSLPVTDIDVMAEQGAIFALDPDRADLFNGRYTVTYDAGWTSPPLQIVQACKEWVKALRFERLRDPGIAEEKTDDVGSVRYVWGVSAANQSQLISTGQHSGAVPHTVAMLINVFKRRIS